MATKVKDDHERAGDELTSCVQSILRKANLKTDIGDVCSDLVIRTKSFGGVSVQDVVDMVKSRYKLMKGRGKEQHLKKLCAKSRVEALKRGYVTNDAGTTSARLFFFANLKDGITLPDVMSRYADAVISADSQMGILIERTTQLNHELAKMAKVNAKLEKERNEAVKYKETASKALTATFKKLNEATKHNEALVEKLKSKPAEAATDAGAAAAIDVMKQMLEENKRAFQDYKKCQREKSGSMARRFVRVTEQCDAASKRIVQLSAEVKIIREKAAARNAENDRLKEKLAQMQRKLKLSQSCLDRTQHELSEALSM